MENQKTTNLNPILNENEIKEKKNLIRIENDYLEIALKKQFENVKSADVKLELTKNENFLYEIYTGIKTNLNKLVWKKEDFFSSLNELKSQSISFWTHNIDYNNFDFQYFKIDIETKKIEEYKKEILEILNWLQNYIHFFNVYNGDIEFLHYISETSLIEKSKEILNKIENKYFLISYKKEIIQNIIKEKKEEEEKEKNKNLNIEIKNLKKEIENLNIEKNKKYKEVFWADFSILNDTEKQARRELFSNYSDIYWNSYKILENKIKELKEIKRQTK